MTHHHVHVLFQSPSLRGSGRFAQREAEARKAAERVSIPFIAGQWSLPLARNRAQEAKLLVSIPFIAGQWSLRCGSVWPTSVT